MRRYLNVQEVADRYRWSTWTVYELARHGRIPHRKIGGTNRLHFDEASLDLWDDGVPLEVRRLPRGGRVVMPKGGEAFVTRGGRAREPVVTET